MLYWMLTQLKKLGFDSREDFIKTYFHLLTDNQKKLAELVDLNPKDGF